MANRTLREIKIAMLKRGLTGRETAKLLGFGSYNYFRNVITGAEPHCRPSRNKIERLFRRKFWPRGRRPSNSKLRNNNNKHNSHPSLS